MIFLALLIVAANAAVLILVHANHKLVMSKLSELETILAAVNGKLEKARTEIVEAGATLKAQIDQQGDPELSAAAQAQLDRLTAVSTSLDDLNPDTPPATEPQG